MKGLGLEPLSSCSKESFPLNVKGDFLIIRGCLTENNVNTRASGESSLKQRPGEQRIRGAGEKCFAEQKVQSEISEVLLKSESLRKH